MDQSAPQIYVVIGATGWPAERSQWLVAAYTKEDDAKAHVLKATEYADAWQAYTATDEYHGMEYAQQEAAAKRANPMDPHSSITHTGEDYWYKAVPFFDKFTAPEAIH